MITIKEIISGYRNWLLRGAARKGQDAVVEAMLKKGANINAKNLRGNTALAYAVAVGHKSTVSILLAKKADPNIKNNKGITPLMFAASQYRLEIAKLLLDGGAEVNDRNNKGNTALTYAIVLAYKDHHADVVELLLRRGADIQSAIDYDTTAEEKASLRIDKIKHLLAIYSEVKKPSALEQQKVRDVEISRATAIFHKKCGLKELESYEFDKAIQEFNEALAINPNDYETYEKRCQAYLFKEDYNRAIDDANKSMSLSHNKASTYVRRGFAYLYSGQLDKAINDANKAITLNCDKSDLSCAYYIIGETYLIKKEFDNAINNYSRSIDVDPCGVAYHHRGKAYASIGHFENAIDDYNNAYRETRVLSPSLYYDRGHAYESIGDTVKTREDINKARDTIAKCGNATVFDWRHFKKTKISRD